MNWWMLPIIAILPLAYLAIQRVYDAVYQRWRVWQSDNLELQRQALANLTHIPADVNGRLGAVVRPDGSIMILDTGRIIDAVGVRVVDQLTEQFDARVRLLLAARGVDGGWVANDAIQQIPGNTVPHLPSQISIQDVLGTKTPTLDSLTIGVTLDEDGNRVPITRSIYDLMHLLVIGITGSGKSTWLLAFLAQIEMCQQPIEVVLIDVHGSAFNLCADWGKLRYPIARNNKQAKAVLDAVRVEYERRSTLYESVPLAEDLASYNANADEPLDPWLVVIDEGTLMLADRDISSYVADSVQGTRQYGIYVFMTGQTANTTSVPSPIRDNFATRICYTTASTSIRVALGDTPPGELEEIPGRGWALLRGKKTPIKIQAPYIRRNVLYEMIQHTGPRYPMPEIEEIEHEDSKPERVRQMYADGESLRTIEKVVYGYAGGAAHDKVTEILGATIATDE